jgi:glycine oxidase
MKDVVTNGSKADVVIIGGGVIGLSIARELARRKLDVLLLERGRFGAEASAAAAGMLAPQAEADRDDDFLQLACASRDLYPEFAQTLYEETGIDIELDRTGTLHLAFTEEEVRELEERYRWQKSAGLEVEILSAAEALSLEPKLSPEIQAALRFPRDWQVENRRLISALVSAAQKLGARLCAGVEATAIKIEGERVEAVETSAGRIHAALAIIACGAWTDFIRLSGNDFGISLIQPVRGQMLCLEARPPIVRHVVYSLRGYLVPRRDGRLLAGSTIERVGFDKSVTVRGLREITDHALEIAPEVAALPTRDSWAGLRPQTRDGWPLIGASEAIEGLFYATGHYRNGILLAPITGKIIGSLICGEEPQSFTRRFTPARFKIK